MCFFWANDYCDGYIVLKLGYIKIFFKIFLESSWLGNGGCLLLKSDIGCFENLKKY